MVVFDIVATKPLSGFSGASIFLATKDGKNWFVRKVAKDKKTAERLKIQIEKQQAFVPFGVFMTPKILETGEHEGSFYADQKYVKGCDAAKYLKVADYRQISIFLANILEYIDSVSREETKSVNQILGLKEKLLSIDAIDKIEGETLNLLISKIEQLDKSLYLGNTKNHGDFTLENMIIDKSGKIWLFDFLNSQFDHYWQDVSKLYQDLLGGWYMRKGDDIPKSTTDYLSKAIYDFTVKLNPAYSEFHNLLICYNFVRILPYAKTTTDKDLIYSRIQYFVKQL